jgi:hypothetical protein
MMSPLMRVFSRPCAVLALLATAIAGAGCDSNATLPEPDEISQVYTTFSGPLEPNGRNVYLVTLEAPVVMQATLAGALVDNPLRSVSPTLQIEIGTFDGTGCAVLESAETQPKFAPAVQRYMVGGTHCVAVSDTRGLAAPVGVVLRVDAPPILGLTGSAGTESFTSTITPRGRATRTFDANATGTATVTLSSLTPSSNAVMGLAVGLHDINGSGCNIAYTTTATAGPAAQLSVPVSPGLYCFAVYDIGNLTTNQTFTLSVSHP